jgi:ascorbate-specific PTS system EIIC-type component UlaA
MEEENTEAKKSFAALKFLAASIVIMAMFMSYVYLIIAVEDQERYNAELEVGLAYQRSQQAYVKEVHDDMIAHKEYRDYILHLEQQVHDRSH